ncbi:hypothetical protein PLESTM_000040900 [Pleodorina starrii]|nr:hypothetical protein PLESTM_000040900 [Pleodorina starrii]
MSDAPVAAGEHRVVNVFSSDDDLTNFLAGLRAKYASLYPQCPEAEYGQGDEGLTTALAGDPLAATSAADGPLVGAASQSFEQKMSQLRSSLQSLQHILPPRTSTTANLLDSFMAVSSDRASAAVAVELGVAAGLLMGRAPAGDGGITGGAQAAKLGPTAPTLSEGTANLIAMESSVTAPDPDPVLSGRCSPPAAITDMSEHDRDSGGGAAYAAATEAPMVAIASGQPAELLAACEGTTRANASGAASARAGELEDVPSDAVFAELAAGYSRHTLRDQSSDVSASSFDGRLSVQMPAPYARDHDGSETGDISLAGSFPQTGEVQQAWQAGELAGAAPALGPPVAATLSLRPPDEPQRTQGASLGAERSLLGQQQQQDAMTMGRSRGERHEGSSPPAAWRANVGQSPGRRRAWQLAGLGAEAAGGCSPEQVQRSQADLLPGYSGGAGADAARPTMPDDSGGLDEPVPRAHGYATANVGAGVGSAMADRKWAAVPPPGGADAAEAGVGTTPESSLAWESTDGGTAFGDDGGGGFGRNSRKASQAGGPQQLDAPSVQAGGLSSAAADRRDCWSARGSREGGSGLSQRSTVLQMADGAKSGVGDWELQQQLSGDVGVGGARGHWPQQFAHRDQRSPDLLPSIEGPQRQQEQQQLWPQQQLWEAEGSGLVDVEISNPDTAEQALDAFYAQHLSGQAQEGAAVLDEAAGEGLPNDDAARQALPGAGGQQRQRRRWGSPIHNARHSAEQQLHGSSPAKTGLDAGANVTATSPERGRRAQWPQNKFVDWPTPSESPNFSHESTVDARRPAMGPSPARQQSPPCEVSGLWGAVAPGSAGGEGPRNPQSLPQAATGPAVEDGAAFGDAGCVIAAEAQELDGHCVNQEQQLQQQRKQQLQQQRPRSGAPQRPLRLLPPPAPAPPPLLSQSGPESASRDAALVVPTPQLEQPLRQQTSVDVWLQPSAQAEHGVAWPANDEVLRGSPTEPPPQPTAALWPEYAVTDAHSAANTGASITELGLPAGSRADGLPEAGAAAGSSDNVVHHGGHVGGSPRGGADSNGITESRGGIAFSISARQAPTDEGSARRVPRAWGAPGPLPSGAAAGAHEAPAAGQPQSIGAALAAMPPAATFGPVVTPGPADWERLNKALREAGFSGLVMAPAGLDAQTAHEPEPASLHRCLSSVLEQYVRRNRLVAELLAATEESGRIVEQQEAAMRELQREANAARAAAEKSRRELADMSSQQLPKVEARHASQLGRLRSETTKLKEALRVSELDLTAKAEEIRSLKATVAGLQSASSHSSDVEGAALRQRVAQLEGLLRNRDKEVEKLKATKEAVVGQAEDGQANALDRAYEAEATARRLEMELTAARARVGQLEQGLRQRERDVAAMREDLQQIKACEAAATLVAQERSAAAEETARRAEGEAAALRGKVKDLEGVLRIARQELDKQRSEAEALRSSAYEEVYRLEDDCRTLGTDLAASRSRVTQLEHVVRAKERDIARVRDEKEAAKAAERERARVAEEVSVKLEAELTAAKVRLTQAEGAVRTRERELAKLAELLRQTQGAEVEAWLKQAKSEEGSRKLENDFTALRLRILQLEATLKGRDKECDKLARTVESLRGEAHELTAKLAKSEEAARKTDADLVVSRGKVLSLEGQLRVKEREQERLVRVVEGLKAGDAEVASRQAALEDAARRLDCQLTAARGRVSALEGVVRARDAAVERLNRQLEALKTADFERAAQALKSEEAARQQDTEAAAVRQRVIHLEGQLRAKERELERSARHIDAARAAEADAARRLADAAAAATKLEAEVAAGRQRAAQLGEALRGRERELAALTRALEAQRAAEHEANAVAGRTEETARKLDGEAGELRQRLIQAEGQLRTREREAERQARALEAAQTAVAEASLRQGEAEAAARRLEADAAGLRQRLAQAEGAVRAREKELERAEKVADQARGAEMAAEAKLRTAEATVVQLDGELSSLRLRISQLESAARGQSKEVERLTRVVDKSKVAEVDAATRAARSDESARQVAAELASARSRLANLEASLTAREQETTRLQRLLAAAEAQAATQVTRSDDFVRRVEADLGNMKQQSTQLAQLIRARDRQLATMRGALEAAQAAEAKAAEQRRQSEEALRKVEGDLAAERQRAVQLDGQVKSREREMERLGRQLDAGRDQSSSAAVTTEREVAVAKEAAAKAEAALSTARARVTQLESELVGKERQLEGLQRLVGNSRAGDAEAAAVAEERTRRAEEAARRLDAELGAVRQRYAHLEHSFRSREASMDKLRAALAEKVAQEERRVARDKAAYQRIRAAYVATMGPSAGGATPGGGAQQQQKAAGAMAAAARELRPVEIVGLYESRREAAEQELAAYRAEVRSLADQLREAQNHIAIKDRTGAWRTPTELADMQARIILLERRSADLQRELDRARLEAAEAARTAERRLAEVEYRATQLKEDNEALVHELESRPTVQDNRTLKREVEILEKRLLQLKGSTAASGAGADAEGGETALSLAVAAKARNAGNLMTTTQRMARDKALHRLGLRALEDWPKDVLVDLVQDVCIELDVRDATTLPAAVRKTLRVVGAVPRMEAFIGAVCDRVYVKGAPFVPPHIDGTTDPSRVLEVLQVWLGLLQEGAHLRGAMRAVVEALAARTEGMATPIHGPGDVVASVRQLVEAEAVALTARESLAAASRHMAHDPEHLLSRLVSHFMRLFDCPSLEGVVPAINKLYVTLNEQRNFARALAAALDLPADAGPSACMARVREAVDASVADGGAGGAATTVQRHALGSGRHGKNPPGAELAVAAAPHGGVAPSVETTAAIEKLMLLFGVRTATAATDAAEKAVTRLKRLDEVLPRYQKLASQLFEALRCTSLEEVMPALRLALQVRVPQEP